MVPTFKELPSSGKDRKQTEGLISVFSMEKHAGGAPISGEGGCMLPGGTDAHDKSYRCLRIIPALKEGREKAGVKEHRREKLSVVESDQGRVVSSRPLSCHFGCQCFVVLFA